MDVGPSGIWLGISPASLDVFQDVWRRAATYDPRGGTVVGWIMGHARSRAMDRARFEQHTERVPADGGTAAVTRSAAPGNDVEEMEHAHHLREALALLTADERQAIEMTFFSELTYLEVAGRLHQPRATVKTRIRSGLLKLQEATVSSSSTTPGSTRASIVAFSRGPLIVASGARAAVAAC